MSAGLWVSPWWQALCLPRRWDVAGISVGSLTLYQMMALEAIGCAYLGNINDATLNDAAALLLFASGDMEHGTRLMNDHRLRTKEIDRIHKRLSAGDAQFIHSACCEYIATCTRAAMRWQKTKDGEVKKGSAVPYQWHLVSCLMKHGMKMDEAWNTPYAVARCLYDANSESNGDDSIVHQDTHQLADEQRAANQ